MYPDLIHSPLQTPLYIRHISSAPLAETFSRLGLEEGVPIQILDRDLPNPPHWVRVHGAKNIWNRAILSPTMTASLLVQSEEKNDRSLILLDNGEGGFVKETLFEENEIEMLGKLGIRNGTYIEKIRPLPVYDFLVELENGKTFWLLLDEAVRIRGSVNRNKTQLAEVRIGQQFVVESIIDDGKPESTGVKGIVPGQSLRIKKLIAPNERESLHSAVRILAKNGMQMCIPRKEAQKISVGICEICWSCGECESIGCQRLF